jgi:hypothetical protein
MRDLAIVFAMVASLEVRRLELLLNLLLLGKLLLRNLNKVGRLPFYDQPTQLVLASVEAMIVFFY